MMMGMMMIAMIIWWRWYKNNDGGAGGENDNKNNNRSSSNTLTHTHTLPIPYTSLLSTFLFWSTLILHPVLSPCSTSPHQTAFTSLFLKPLTFPFLSHLLLFLLSLIIRLPPSPALPISSVSFHILILPSSPPLLLLFLLLLILLSSPRLPFLPILFFPFFLLPPPPPSHLLPTTPKPLFLPHILFLISNSISPSRIWTTRFETRGKWVRSRQHQFHSQWRSASYTTNKRQLHHTRT